MATVSYGTENGPKVIRAWVGSIFVLLSFVDIAGYGTLEVLIAIGLCWVYSIPLNCLYELIRAIDILM